MQKQNYFFLFLFFALISGGLQAQVVTIPDPNFLAALIQNWVDTNGDGQIQQTEAEARTSLDVSYSSISSLVGIESFVNLQSLSCYYNQLTTLDVSALVNLQSLSCGYNQLTTLDVSALANLQTLSCSINPLTTLDVSALVNLQSLSCGNNQLTTLDVSALVNLQTLDCYANQLTTLDVSALVNLQSLDCNSNQLTTLDVSALVNLQTLGCNSNQLTTLDVSALVNLQSLYCFNNQLLSLNIKNGHNENNLIFSNNPNLQCICIDTVEATSVQNLIAQYGLQNVVVSSTVCTTGIDNEPQISHFQCFPNPAHDLLSLTTSSPLEIEIVNVLGETLIRKLVQGKEDIDISTLAAGMYWIKEKNTGMGQVFMKE